MRTDIKRPIYALAASAAVGLLPAIPVLVAGAIANLNDCVLHEGSVNPCVVLGVDIGPQLYAMGVLGWLMLVSIPIGVAGILGSGIWMLIAFLKRRSNPVEGKRRAGA